MHTVTGTISRHNKLRTGKKPGLYNIVGGTILTIWALLIIYPFYNTLLVSIVPFEIYARTPLMLYPKGFTLEAYEIVLRSENIFYAFRSSVIVVIFGVIYSMLLSTMTAYSLARPNYPGRKLFHNLIIFTMYFSGGLIPYYILVNKLSLSDTLAALILPLGINTFYMFIIKVQFQNIPESLIESAKLDGANEFHILFNIIIPVSLPIMATFILFYGVDRWNDWFGAVLFIKTRQKTPLQPLLRSVIANFVHLSTSEFVTSTPENQRMMLMQDSIKMACVMFTAIPVICLYPIVQKYFVRGIMIGSIKS